MKDEQPVCAITGSGGYVGSRVAQSLRDHAQVVALTRSPSGENDVAWSLTSKEDLAPALRRLNVSVLIHVAWDFRAVTAKEIEQVNVEGSIRLFKMAKAAGVRRIVFISTLSAFENARSLYGKSKLRVEAAVAELGGVILRPGLVFGESPGGVFGSIRKQVRSGRLIPLIGRGRAPQYLVPEKILSDLVADAAMGRFDEMAGRPITIANPTPWPFRELVQSIARAEGQRVMLVSLPWQLLYAGLRLGEGLGCKLPFRSDSVTSFVYQDPAPDFSALTALGISVPAYKG
jgi:nucleoside-diphosphate-sugar epimerase